MVTGEPIPAEKIPGSRVVGATINGTGSLVMRAERVGAETLLARIVQMVAEAQRSRAPIQKLADRVSAVFVPTVVGVAALTFVVWAIVGPEPRMAYALVNAVAVLIIACPCALGLATPMSIMVATGRGATMGVLFRNAEAIEVLRKVDTLVVDKTGTLTEGKPRLVPRGRGGAVDGSGRPPARRRSRTGQRASPRRGDRGGGRGAAPRARRVPPTSPPRRGRASPAGSTAARSRWGTPRCSPGASADVGALAARAEALRGGRRRP